MNKKKVFKFLGITFLITWTAFLIRAILCNINVIGAYSLIGMLLYGIAVLGPTISTIICLEDRSPKKILNFIFNHKKGTIKYLILFSVLYFLSFYISTFTLKPEYPLYLFPVICLVMLLFGGLNEEIGWSGILYPELAKKFKAPAATGIYLAIWFVWHLPMFITYGDSHYGMPIISFITFLLTLSLIKTALIRRTECVFYCGVLHAVANVAETYVAYEANTIMVIANVVIWIIAVLLWYFPKDKNEDNDNEEKEMEKVESEEVITPIVNPELPTPAINGNNKEEVEELI